MVSHEVPSEDADATVTGARSRSQSGLVPKVGASVGRYVVLGQVGSGGMGIVLRAYDPLLEREVALKVLRPSLLSERARARVLREARAMAKLSHPNVVPLYDIDLDATHGVVLAMELVAGGTMAQWLEGAHAWDEVVDRFVAAGRGLVAAHDAGLLHRDFKPTNVLIGDDGRARVTDFGLACQADRVEHSQALSSHPDPVAPSGDEMAAGTPVRLTEAGAVVGTLAYMAPEQHDTLELTTAADQFAFCASLWHGLTGSLPFDAKAVAEFDGLKRGAPPSWPRDIHVPSRVIAALQRGLSTDPSSRWPSMPALLAELERPRFRRRRYGAIAMGFGLVGATAWAAVALSDDDAPAPCSQGTQQLAESWSEERRQQVRDAMRGSDVQYAERVHTAVDNRLQVYADGWVDAYTDNCEATNVRRDQSAEVMDLRMQCLSRARAGLSAAAELLSDGSPEMLDKAFAIVDGLVPLVRCDDIDRLRAEAPPPSRPEIATAVADARAALAGVELTAAAGRYDEARAGVDGLVASTATLGHAPLALELAILGARLRVKEGDIDGAEQALTSAATQALSLGLRATAVEAANQLIFVVGYTERRHDAAEAWASVAEGLVNHPQASDSERAGFLNHRGALRQSQERPVDAEADYRAALALYVELRDPEHVNNALIMENIAGALFNQGRLDEGVEQMLEAMALSSKVWGNSHPSTIKSRMNLSLLRQAQGKLEEAEADVKKAIADAEEVLGLGHPVTLNGLTYLALVQQKSKQLAQAEATMRTIVKRRTDAHGSGHLEVARARLDLARVIKGRGDHGAAEAEVRAALPVLESLGEQHTEVLRAYLVLADTMHRGGRPGDAVPVLERVVKASSEQSPNSPQYADAAFRLAKALRDLSRTPDRAQALAEAALAIRRGKGGNPSEVAKIEEWLAGSDDPSDPVAQ